MFIYKSREIVVAGPFPFGKSAKYQRLSVFKVGLSNHGVHSRLVSFSNITPSCRCAVSNQVINVL